MFRRLLFHLLRGNQVRLVVALVALVSGGAVISAMLNLDLDISRKLKQEFRSLGANLVISAPQTAATAVGSPGLLEESVMQTIEKVNPSSTPVAPYLYLVAQGGPDLGQDVVVAGSWLDRMPQIAPWWKISGGRTVSRDDLAHCLIGRNVSQSLGVSTGNTLELRYGGRSADLTVAGVINSGDSADNQVFVNLSVAQQLSGLNGKIELVQLSVPGSASEIKEIEENLQSALPGLEVRPIQQIAAAEGSLFHRIRFLVISTGVLILVLTALCVLATMAALAMERRRDVGLMKALGGSIQRIVRLFLAEVGILGAVGGVLGYGVGMLLSAWMGYEVFGTNIAPHWEVLPLTVALMFLVSLAGALPLRLLGNVRPAVILRGE
jgi:putative ABC transport system permease protein